MTRYSFRQGLSIFDKYIVYMYFLSMVDSVILNMFPRNSLGKQHGHVHKFSINVGPQVLIIANEKSCHLRGNLRS